jgi:RNA polymerase sigma-70 factor (ECF subfamily)
VADDRKPGGRRTFDLSVLDPDPVKAERAYEELRRSLLRFLESRTTQPEEVAQEALLRGLQQLAAGADISRSTPRGYVFGVAKNVALEWFRKETREPAMDPADQDLKAGADLGHAKVEMRLAIERALRDMSPVDRSTFLRYYTDDDHAALSHELGISRGHLRLLVHRMRNRIRANLGLE